VIAGGFWISKGERDCMSECEQGRKRERRGEWEKRERRGEWEVLYQPG